MQKHLTYCVNMDLLKLKCYWKCFQFNNTLAICQFFCVVLSKFDGYSSIIVDVFVCVFDFYKDGSKSIHLS